jgi:hypothetical protein
MTEDITSQLRRWSHSVTALPASKLMGMAADEIDRLRLFAVSEAEIDALEYVVVEGRMASKQDYGVLRALLVRLRPEWATSGDLGLRPEEGDLRNGSPDGRETVQ